MRKILMLAILMSVSFIAVIKGQNYNSYLEESKPLSPAAYQFLKYTALPVSEYTGIPEVTMPIYEIKEDGLSIPVNLSYHASGITVNEEATSVGLGWNLQFGSIVQIVNDQSDMNSTKTKLLPDYIGQSVPSVLPLKYPWPYQTPGSPTSFPVGNTYPDFRFPIATHNYFPINGDYTIEQYDLFNNSNYDSEPDIFKANFFGHSVNFIKDFKNGGQIVVLNRVGYKVSDLTANSWCITVPSGEEFYFTLKNVTRSEIASSSTGGPNSNPSSSTNDESTIIYYLTKIVTKNKREIVFNYTQTSPFKHFPGFSQTWKSATQTGSNNATSAQGAFPAFWYNVLGTSPSGNITSNIFLQIEPHVVPSSIVFPLGRLDFYSSDRDDVLGGKKIDSVSLTALRLKKSFKLQYSYMNSSSVGGNGFTYDNSSYGNRAFLRLKLDSFIDATGGVHQFLYDSTLLPGKNSYALDQWGYYNGTLTNSNLIPNPTQYNKPELGNNGNNHSANEPYTKAGTLKQIIYPTGGSVSFDMELNDFNTYFVPDYGSSSNALSHGNGLRVKQISWRQADNTISKIQRFEYEEGKALLPLNMFRNFQYTTGTGNYYNSQAGAYFSTVSYNVNELNANGYYSPSSLSEINGVGYGKVTSKLVDQGNNSLGAIVRTFYNTPAISAGNSVQSISKTNVSVPAREDRDMPKNGLIKSVRYLDKLGNLQKKSVTTYNNYNSAIYYGARISNYGNYIFYTPPSGTFSGQWDSKLQWMVAEYPIYDFESLPTLVNDVDYFAAGDSTVTNTLSYYTPYRLPTTIIKQGANYKEETNIHYTNLSAMLNANRFSDMIYRSNSKMTTTVAQSTRNPDNAKTFSRTFTQIGDKFLPVQEIISENSSSASSRTYYDAYDGNGNVSQITDPTGTTSLIWGYTNHYLIAKITNALRSECAFTSFEQSMLELSGDWVIYPSLQPASRPAVVGITYVVDGHAGVYSNNASSLESKMLPQKDYTFTLFAKGSGTITVNGSARTISGGWQKYEWQLPNITKVSLSKTGSILMDDLSVYPKGAQITTYTYDPLVGVTSSTDEKGKITTYEYDSLKRLRVIKDQNGNFLKSYDYHLAGQ
jgi:YD repeat-containing protein